MSYISTIDSDPHLERWRRISDVVSSDYKGAWDFKPLANAECEPDLDLARSDGVAISKAAMPPMELFNAGGESSSQVFHLTQVSQRSTLLIGERDPLQLAPGDLVFLSSRTPCRWLVNRPYVTSTIHVEEDLLREHVPDPDRMLGRRLNCPFGLHEAVMHTMESALRIADDGQFERVGHSLIRSALHILSIISEREPDQVVEPVTAIETRSNQIKRMIRRNFTTPGFSVEDIARSLQITPRYVQLALANEGLSPSEFVKKCRLEAAADMLRAHGRAGQTITQIAFDCGFNSSAHFSTEFRKAYGRSPREYRALG